MYVANISSGCFKSRSGVATGDPPAVAGVQAGEIEGARAHSAWGQEERGRSDGHDPHVGA
jgi:hypothetical protein